MRLPLRPDAFPLQLALPLKIGLVCLVGVRVQGSYDPQHLLAAIASRLQRHLSVSLTIKGPVIAVFPVFWLACGLVRLCEPQHHM